MERTGSVSQGSYREREESSDEEVALGRGKLRLQLTDSDEENDASPNEQTHRNRPPRPSHLPRTSRLRQSTSHRRRRSSARFMSVGRNEEGRARSRAHSRKSLAVIYKEEIRMNAENRINATNSWDMKMIDNLENFLTEEGDDPTFYDATMQTRGPESSTLINFTKASCSLDASVKIYGHRVDNVYLTSYKVLANLNRSHSNNSHQNGHNDDGQVNGEITVRPKKPTGPTLESNISNINVNKLDSAIDIDPLFHKMSRAFDEGGAKGLLLINLGTGEKHCMIVFDTQTLDEDVEDEEQNLTEDSNQTYVDMSLCLSKLDEPLEGRSIDSIPLVSQLGNLRAEFAELEDEGFVDLDASAPIQRPYAAEYESEEEADRSIHLEALERSRLSANLRSARKSHLDQSRIDSGEPENFDFGGHDDGGYDDYIGDDDGGERFSSLSFTGTLYNDDSQEQNTAAVLDAIAAGRTVGRSDYEFFDQHALSHVSGNAWAGALHWKPAVRPKKDIHREQTDEKKLSRKVAKERRYVDLTFTPDMTDILRMPPKARGMNKSNPLQFSKTVLAKHTCSDNLLPVDAYLTVHDFNSLFLRPKSSLDVCISNNDASRELKTVAFDMGPDETYGGDWDNDSYGGGDDGDGFAFAESGFGAEEGPEFAGLNGIRHVEKIQIGYATIAKKVDVKRLKQDLWTEIETHLPERPENHNSLDEVKESELHVEDIAPHTPSKSSVPLSFFDTVQEMERSKKQADASLPFYFMCILHLANEQELRLEPQGLDDFLIYRDQALH